MAKQTSPLSADELLAKVAATKDFTSQSQMADKTIDADVVDWIDTQAASLNLAIGRPGIPVGRMTLLVGKEKAGKSTCGYHLLQETQRRGGIAILIDSERRYTRDRAERIGIDHPKLIYIPGDTVESTFQEIQTYVSVVREQLPIEQPVTIVWDSLAGTPLAGALKGEVVPAGHAKLVGQWFRSLLPQIARKRVALVMVNQLRTRIDMGGGTYFNTGSTDTMLADKALSYHCSLKIHFTMISREGEDPIDKKPTGIVSRAEIQANTVARPYRTAVVHIDFKTGYDKDACAFEAARELKLITQNGSWWVFEGKNFQRTKWSEILNGNEELQKNIREAPTQWQL